MNWTTKDIEIFIREKEYIDTVLIPLMPISITNMKRSAEQSEFISLLTLYIERQFKGRIVLLPPFTYLNAENERERLRVWIEQMREGGFSYVFTITADNGWKSYSDELESHLINLPSIPLEHMDDSLIQATMDEQVKALLPEILQGWR